MTRDAMAAMLGRMRCLQCKRAPTDGEVGEMVEQFGPELVPSDGPRLRWQCLACQELHGTLATTLKIPSSN